MSFCEEMIRDRLEANGLAAVPEQIERIHVYFQMLKEWNTRMDLIAQMSDEEIIDRHFVDSLTVLKTELLPDAGKVIDVGTGAGFPGMVLAMMRENLSVTLMDAQMKRLKFLSAVQEACGIRNVEIIHGRAEELGRRKEYREAYDAAVARAVAPLSVLCEYLLPFVRMGGCALCWKGPAIRDEMENGRRAAHLLGGRLEMPVECPVSGRDWNHLILPIRKTEKTSREYPRKAGVPKARPLGGTQPA